LAASCDHLLVGAPELGPAVAALARRTGVRATPAGHDPDLGTHAALARLGRARFLAVVAPDPACRPGAFARRLSTLAHPTLCLWAVATPDADAAAARIREEGYDAAVVESAETRPDGRVVRSRRVFASGHGAGIFVPFFVQWENGAHPAGDAADGLRLASLHGESPQPEALRAVLEALDVRLPVHRADEARLVATLDTPRGRVTLTGP
jgi:hypothetical protein